MGVLSCSTGQPRIEDLPLHALPRSQLRWPQPDPVPVRPRDMMIVDILTGAVEGSERCASDMIHWREWRQPRIELLALRHSIADLALAHGWSLWFGWRNPSAGRRLADDQATLARIDYHRCIADHHTSPQQSECDEFMHTIIASTLESEAAQSAEFGAAAVLSFVASINSSSNHCMSEYEAARHRLLEQSRQQLMETAAEFNRLPPAYRGNPRIARVARYAFALLGHQPASTDDAAVGTCDQQALDCLQNLTSGNRCIESSTCHTMRSWLGVNWVLSPESPLELPTSEALFRWLLSTEDIQ